MKVSAKVLRAVFASLFALTVIFSACGGDKQETKNGDDTGVAEPGDASGNGDQQKTDYDPKTAKGVGEVKHVELTKPLDGEMVSRGQMIYDMKCSSCHKLNEERVVGPGWAGITSRRTPEWIMNMITNVDMMLAEDPEAQKLLEQCLTRMPNQNISIGDSRDILEFMRKNDGEK